MRTSKFHNSDVTTLRINKDSHKIHKSSSFPAASSPSHHHQPVPAGGKRQPVIIYTQSPRIIHTQAHEFMTLVQKLTGLDRAEEDNRAKSDQSEHSTTDEGSIFNEDIKNNVMMIKNKEVMIKNNDDDDINNNNNYYYLGNDENESSSFLTTDEKFVAHESSPISSMYNVSTYMNNNPYLIDERILGPGSSDFLCSSGANSSFDQHPISPSIFDIMKGYPDY